MGEERDGGGGWVGGRRRVLGGIGDGCLGVCVGGGGADPILCGARVISSVQ